MAHRGSGRPKRLEERYLDLIGDEDEEASYYLVKRKLGFGPDEWDALPWHHKRMYLNGLNLEFGDPDANDVVDGSDARVLEELGFTTGIAQ